MTKRVRSVVDKCVEALNERDELVEALEAKKEKLQDRAVAYDTVIDALNQVNKTLLDVTLTSNQAVEVQKLLDKFGGSMTQNASYGSRWNISL